MKKTLSQGMVRKEGASISGTITIRSYRAGTKELLSTIVQKNMIMQTSGRGKTLFVERLIGTVTYTGIINYGAIGTGSTAVTASDTQLATETVRTTVADAVVTGDNEAQIQFFFADANLANGTYNEFGTFVDGTASANSGRLFNRAIFTTPYVKATGTDTTIEVDILVE